MGRVLSIASAIFVTAIVVGAQAQKTVWDGVYTEEQAKRGAEVYTEKCAMCHGDSLGGVESAPALTGPAFYATWEGENLNALFERIRMSMPQDNPGSLSRTQNADIVAHMLHVGGYPAGSAPLEGQAGALTGIKDTHIQTVGGNRSRQIPTPKLQLPKSPLLEVGSWELGVDRRTPYVTKAADWFADNCCRRRLLDDGIGARSGRREEGRVADLRRRSRAHALRAARPDQRRQLQQARSRVAFQDRQPRPAPRIQPRVDAADGQRPCSTRPAGTRRAVVALDAATGELLWMHSEREGARGAAAPRQLSGRGLAYWTDGTEERILYVTPGYRLVALDAKTGNRVPGFGSNGIVDLKHDFDQELDLVTGAGRPPLDADRRRERRHRRRRVRDRREPEEPKQRQRRTFAASTCAPASGSGCSTPFPQPGEFGNETWENDSWAYTGNTGVWAQISVDEELGLAYLPVELPTHDYYGGARPGQRPVRREPRRRRSADRPAQVALPAGAPRHLGHGHPVRADPRRHHRQRPHDQGGRAADQAGVPLCVRPRDRPADLADRGAAGAAGRCARRDGTRRRSRFRPSRRPTTGRAWPSTI